MQIGVQTTPNSSKKLIWTGRVFSGVVVLFLLFDSIGKLMQAAPVVKGTAELGFSSSVVFPLGLVLLVCTLLYAIPRTSVLGAILLTGYLGGAVAVQVRVGHPLLGFVMFPVYVGILQWGGLFLRDDRIRALIPWRSKK